MRRRSAWKVMLFLTFGFIMLALGFFLGRNSGVTIVYEQPAVQVALQEQHVPNDTAPVSVPPAQEKVNINTADASALESLPGIGPVIAQRIVEYRQTYGLFRTIDQIKDVSGIGEATFAELEPWITVGE